MSFYSIIVPEATTNLILDPIAGAADPDTSWTIAGDGIPDVTRSTADAFWGDGSFLFNLGAGTYTDLYQTTTVTNTSYTFSCWIKRSGGGTVSSTQVQCWFDNAAVNFDSITLHRDGWYYCVYTGTATAGSRQFGIRGKEASLQADGCQLENLAYATTFVYGDRNGNTTTGFQWTGTRHASTSTRSGQERSGGRVRDLADVYSFYVESIGGIGLPSPHLSSSNPASIDGVIYNNSLYNERTITLTGTFIGSSYSNLHSVRNTLINQIKRDKVTPQQPVILRYSGGTELLEIAGYYEGGLEFQHSAKDGFSEKAAIRLFCPFPYWNGVGNEAVQLDVNDAITTNYIVQRSTSGYSNLDTTINAAVRAITKANDGTLYIGGSMTAPGNYAVSWDGTSLAALSTGPGDDIYSMVTDSSGNLWAGSDNTTLKKWNSSTWAATSVAPSNTIIQSLALDENDNIYAVGSSGVFEWWNDVAWTEVGTLGANGTVNTIYVDGTDIYYGGAFTQIGGVSANYIAKLDTTTLTFSALDSGPGGEVFAITKYSGSIYAGYASGLKKWGGAAWVTIGSSVISTSVVYSLHVWSENTGDLIIGGRDAGEGGSWRGLTKYDGTTFTNIATSWPVANGYIYALASDSTYVYFGGDFFSMNSVGDCTYIGRYNDSAISAMGTYSARGIVRAIAVLSGNVYFGGDYTNWEGNANMDYIGYWTGSAYSAMSTGANNIVRALSIISSVLWIGGDFTSPHTRLMNWDTSAFNAIGSGLDGSVYAITVNSTDAFIGGAFTNGPADRISIIDLTATKFYNVNFSTADSNNASRHVLYACIIDTSSNVYAAGEAGFVIKYDSTATTGEVLGKSLFRKIIYALAIDPITGYIWAGGAAGLLAYYNFNKWITISTSLTTEIIYALTFASDGTLYVGGNFTAIGGDSNAGGIAFYSGGNFYALDIDLPGSPTVNAIHIDGTIITIGFTTAGSSSNAGTTTVTNNGTGLGFPIFNVKGPGNLISIKNETTGKTIRFTGLTLGTNETVTLDLRHLQKTFVSDSRNPPNIVGKIQQSDVSTFALQPGDNSISTFVNNAGATGMAIWQPLHDSVDGAEN